MISGPGPERRRRRPAVCNRESPCNNCLKSKSNQCVYENDVPPRQQRPNFSHTAAVDRTKTTQDRPQMLAPDAPVSRVPSYASRSVPSSSRDSLSGSHVSNSEVDSMKSTIRRLEEQLAKVTNTPSPPPQRGATSNIETTTSQIAGTFHVNHESRITDDHRALSRNLVIHKSRVFGASHWAQAAAMFRDIFEMIEPCIREKGPKAVAGVKRCKELARIIKAQRQPQWPTPPTTDLPPKGVADELVDCYLKTIETSYRILHTPTFRTEYDALWVSDAKPNIAFIVQLKLVLAIGSITYDNRFSMRASANRWVYEALTWLSDPDFKSRLNIQSLQSTVLLLIARETINVGGDSSWISAGALLRTALYMGLHRDPTHLPTRTALVDEVRRRLWNTILELTLQSSIISGGIPMIPLDDSDCQAPGNFDDDQLLADDPVPKPDHEYTQTSIAREMRKTFAQRLAIANFLNGLGSYGTYEETLRLDSDLRKSYREVCRALRRYSSQSGPLPSSFETRVLDFNIHYYLCCLHMPFFEKSLLDAPYAFSRKVVVESALKVWCSIFPSSNLMAGAGRVTTPTADDLMTRFVTSGFGFFRIGIMLATMFVSRELKCQLEDADSLGPSPYRMDLVSLLSDAKDRYWTMIECGETNVKGYLLCSLVDAQTRGLMEGVPPGRFPEYLFQEVERAEQRCLAFMEEEASLDYNGPDLNAVNDFSNSTAPFMGDWEFIYSQTLQHITDAKLEELSNKRQIFLDRKAAALRESDSLDSPLESLRVLSKGVKTCFDITVKDDGRVSDTTHSNRSLVIELSNLDRFLKQAEYDPAISSDTLDRWRRSLLSILDVQTLKYEYATLFAQLTMEWLAVKKTPKSSGDVTKSDDFEKLASARKLESRRKWEDHVFIPADCDAVEINTFLHELFGPSSSSPDQSFETQEDAKSVAKALEALRDKVTRFEISLSGSSHFNTNSLQWVIEGLLNSDLPTEKQRSVLREFRQDYTVLAELADVLNMRLAALHSWSWGTEVSVEQRRQLNGSYHIHLQEDLIQMIFLQYLGVKWSVFFKDAFKGFRSTKNVWKSPRSSVSTYDQKRRWFFLDNTRGKNSVQMVRECVHRNAYFVSQLMNHEYQVRKNEEGEMEAQPHAKRGRAKQSAVQAPIAMQQMPAARMAAPRARIVSAAVTEEMKADDFDDEDMGFGLFDGDDNLDADQTYQTNYAQGVMKPDNQMQAKQNLLLLLGADITINKCLYGEITCFRTQYESLFPSLPHLTILEVLKFFGMSEKWIKFFERFLAAPLKFVDEPDSEPRLRRRGTPASHVLSDVFGEATLFCLDYMINKETKGEALWRVNDDMWFWSRNRDNTLGAWVAIQKFSRVMGLPLGEDKSGSAYITLCKKSSAGLQSLPTGKIRWGMLYLNSESGRFEIDQEMVNDNIKELKRQLENKESSIFGWIQAWNTFASTFFTYNFGTPANCFGQEHVDMMLQTHERLQREIFSRHEEGTGDRSVITYLRDTIRSRFGNTSIPDGYFFLPIDLGGLELSSSFINLLGLRDSVTISPDSLVYDFLKKEADAYATAKRRYASKDKDRLIAKFSGFRPENIDTFLPFDEYIRHREYLDYGFSGQLVNVYDDLLRRPTQQQVQYDSTGPVSLYGPEVIERFGGFNVVDPGLLPIGLISQFRSGRVSWSEE
ncbi:uncharacterized protein BDV14DRAFT_190779 [Aspergillus stella-maris]|uniref:uncharacterized protein n=1 Tax=Aspergillus stella-maris TaxID=1810926 RepID=UPI003CCCA145